MYVFGSRTDKDFGLKYFVDFKLNLERCFVNEGSWGSLVGNWVLTSRQPCSFTPGQWTRVNVGGTVAYRNLTVVRQERCVCTSCEGKPSEAGRSLVASGQRRHLAV